MGIQNAPIPPIPPIAPIPARLKLKPTRWSLCAGEQLSEIEKAVVEKEADVSRQICVVSPKLYDTSRTYEFGTFITAVFKTKYARASQKEIREDLSALSNTARCCMQCELVGGTIQVTCAARVFQCACVVSPVLIRCVTSQTAGSPSTHCVVDAMLRNSAVLAALPLAGTRCLECVMLPAFSSRVPETQMISGSGWGAYCFSHLTPAASTTWALF
jgi:hypothetical protein